MAATYTSFGNFLLLKQRSQDGLGSLWRGGEMERLGFKRVVWLRRFDQVGLDRTALAADSQVVNQLAQAFRATNVVRNAVYGVEGGVPYLAWDYVPSQPLDQLLARVAQEQFPVAIDNALLIAEKLSAALAAGLAVEVRGEPLIHGFLVPQLVLIGNDGEALVAGFGLSRGLLANLDRVAVQQMAAPYLAPEVIASRAASRRSDVYSLGAVLYQLLCGSPLPADPAARPAALQAPHLAWEEGPVPQDVLAIIQKACAAKPDDRFASAADFKRELEKLLYGGAYSPTTFNLALLMDRLYRHEIEEEDRELQREKGLDVTPYMRPARAEATEPSPVVEAAKPPSRTGLYAALGGVAVLLLVIVYLLVGRPAPKAGLDAAAIKAAVQEEMAQYKNQIDAQNKALADERARNEQLQKQIEETQQKAATAKKPLSAAEQAALDQQKRELEARQAEQRRREQQIAQLQEKQKQLAAAAESGKLPTEIATAAPPKPTAAAVQATQAPVATVGMVAKPTSAPPAAEPTAVQVPPASSTQAPTTVPAVPGAGLGTAVREGDLVDPTQVDVPPQKLVEAKVVLPRVALESFSAASGVVILQALVTEKGAVDQVKVLRGFPVQRLGVDEACIDAVKQSRYKPAMKDGVRVKTWITVTFRVDLTRPH